MYKNIFSLFVFLVLGCVKIFGAQNDSPNVLLYLEKTDKTQCSSDNTSVKLVFKNFSNQEIPILRPSIRRDFIFYAKDVQGIIIAKSEVKKVKIQHIQDKFLLFPQESFGIEFKLSDLLPLKDLPSKIQLFFEFSPLSSYHDKNEDFILLTPLSIDLVSKDNEKMISSAEAVQIAQNALSDTMREVVEKENAPPILSYGNKIYIVTFPYKTLPSRRGPDFLFRVTVDATSGKVLSCIAGG